MDVRFCKEQEPPPRGTRCELKVLRVLVLRAPHRRALGELFFLLTDDLHGGRLSGQGLAGAAARKLSTCSASARGRRTFSVTGFNDQSHSPSKNQSPDRRSRVTWARHAIRAAKACAVGTERNDEAA